MALWFMQTFFPVLWLRAQASFLGFISLLSRISWLLVLWPPEDCVPFRFYLKEMIVLALFIHTVSAAEWRALLLEGR